MVQHVNLATSLHTDLHTEATPRVSANTNPSDPQGEALRRLDPAHLRIRLEEMIRGREISRSDAQSLELNLLKERRLGEVTSVLAPVLMERYALRYPQEGSRELQARVQTVLQHLAEHYVGAGLSARPSIEDPIAGDHRGAPLLDALQQISHDAVVADLLHSQDETSQALVAYLNSVSDLSLSSSAVEARGISFCQKMIEENRGFVSDLETITSEGVMRLVEGHADRVAFDRSVQRLRLDLFSTLHNLRDFGTRAWQTRGERAGVISVNTIQGILEGLPRESSHRAEIQHLLQNDLRSAAGALEFRQTLRSALPFLATTRFEAISPLIGVGAAIAGSIATLIATRMGLGSLGVAVCSGGVNGLFQVVVQMGHEFYLGRSQSPREVIAEFGEAFVTGAMCGVVAVKMEGLTGRVARSAVLGEVSETGVRELRRGLIRLLGNQFHFWSDILTECGMGSIEIVKHLLGVNESNNLTAQWWWQIGNNATGELAADPQGEFGRHFTTRIETRVTQLQLQTLQEEFGEVLQHLSEFSSQQLEENQALSNEDAVAMGDPVSLLSSESTGSLAIARDDKINWQLDQNIFLPWLLQFHHSGGTLEQLQQHISENTRLEITQALEQLQIERTSPEAAAIGTHLLIQAIVNSNTEKRVSVSAIANYLASSVIPAQAGIFTGISLDTGATNSIHEDSGIRQNDKTNDRGYSPFLLNLVSRYEHEEQHTYLSEAKRRLRIIDRALAKVHAPVELATQRLRYLLETENISRRNLSRAVQKRVRRELAEHPTQEVSFPNTPSPLAGEENARAFSGEGSTLAPLHEATPPAAPLYSPTPLPSSTPANFSLPSENAENDNAAPWGQGAQQARATATGGRTRSADCRRTRIAENFSSSKKESLLPGSAAVLPIAVTMGLATLLGSQMARCCHTQAVQHMGQGFWWALGAAFSAIIGIVAAAPKASELASETEDDSAVSTPIEVPLLQVGMALSENLIRQMNVFPNTVKEDYEEAGKGERLDPIHFGFNHIGWWLEMIKRDSIELGTRAVVWGGELLFGRFQKTKEERLKVKRALERMVEKEEVQTKVTLPSPALWWKPVLDRILLATTDLDALGKEAVLLVLRQVHDPEIVTDFLAQLKEKNFEFGFAIESDLTDPEVSVAEAPAPDSLAAIAESLKADALAQKYKDVNNTIEPLFLRFAAQEDLKEAIAGIHHLKKIVEALPLDGNLPSELSGIEAVGRLRRLPPESHVLKAGQRYQLAQNFKIELDYSMGQMISLEIPEGQDQIKVFYPVYDENSGSLTRVEKVLEPSPTPISFTASVDFTLVNNIKNKKGPFVLVRNSSNPNLYTLTNLECYCGPVSVIPRQVISFGREGDNHILTPQDDRVSRKHFRLTLRPDGTLDIVDRDSSNGTYFKNKGAPDSDYSRLPANRSQVIPPGATLSFGRQYLEDRRKNYSAAAEIVASEEEGQENIWILRNVEKMEAPKEEANPFIISPAQRFELTPEKVFSIGRHFACDISIADAMVSGEHLTLQIDKDGLLNIEDDHSSNGTQLYLAHNGTTEQIRRKTKIKIPYFKPVFNPTHKRANCIRIGHSTIQDIRLDIHAAAELVQDAADLQSWYIQNKAIAKSSGTTSDSVSSKLIGIPSGAKELVANKPYFMNIESAALSMNESNNEAEISFKMDAQGNLEITRLKNPINGGRNVMVMNGRILGGDSFNVIQITRSANLAGTQPPVDFTGTQTLAKGDGLIINGNNYLTNQITHTGPDYQMAFLKDPNRANCWMIRSVKKDPALSNPQAFKAPKNYYKELPRRPLHSIPKEYRGLIPQMPKVVLFARFLGMLDEIASLINLNKAVAIRLFGPPGTAKTTLPEIIASAMGVPLLRVPFSKRTDSDELVGVWGMKKVGAVLAPVFIPGPLTVAMEHGFHAVLDEPDTAKPGTLAALNNIIQHSDYFWTYDEKGELVRKPVHPAFRVYATENGTGQLGRHDHGPDFLRRFVSMYVGPWTFEETLEVVEKLFACHNKGKRRWSQDLSQRLVVFHEHMIKAAQGAPPITPLGSGVEQKVEFTPRSILRLSQRLAASPQITPAVLNRALRAEYILPLADKADRDRVWEVIKTTFKDYATAMHWHAEAIGPQNIPQPTLEEIYKNYLPGRALAAKSFVWTRQALNVVDEILWNHSLGVDVMLLGEAGEGKSTIPEQLAKLLGYEFIDHTLSANSDETELVGGLRKNPLTGEYNFSPGKVHRAVTRPSVLLLDEFLLADPPKVEGIFNPLLDSDKALYLKNPYARIERDKKSLIVMSSNPPFGKYAGRNQQSGAAMSRVAVMYLMDDFGMSTGDRAEIVKHMMNQPAPLAGAGIAYQERVSTTAAPAVDEEATTNPVGPAVFKNITAQDPGPEAQAVTLNIHPDFQTQQFQLPARLVVVQQQGQWVYAERDARGALVPISAATRKKLERVIRYLTERTQREIMLATGKAFKINFNLGEENFANPQSKEITIGLSDLLTRPLKAALGIGKHEWAHLVIDGVVPRWHRNAIDGFLFNAAGERRMNNFVRRMGEKLMAKSEFEEQMTAFEGTSQPKAYTDEYYHKMGRYLPHEQFCYALAYYAYHGNIPLWVTDPDVYEALEKACPLLKPAFEAFPQEINAQERQDCLDEFCRHLESAYPIFEQLLPKGMNYVQNLIQQMLNEGKTPQEIVEQLLEHLEEMLEQMAQQQQGQGQRQGEGQESEAEGDSETNPRVSEEAKEIAQQVLENRAEKMAEEFEPHSPALKRMNNEEVAKARAAQQEQDSDEAEEGDAAGDAAEGQAKPGAAKPGKPGRPGKPGKAGPAALDKQNKGARGEAEREKDRAAHADKQAEVAEADEAEAAEEAAPPPDIVMSPQDLEALKNAMQQVEAAATQDLGLFEKHRPKDTETSNALAELHRLIPPDNPSERDGPVARGPQMDVKAAAQDEMRAVPTGRVFQNNAEPGQYEAQIILVSDVSGSMAPALNQALAGSATLIFFCETLGIDYGEIVFANGAEWTKPLGAPTGSYQEKNKVLNKKQEAFHAMGGGTDIRKAIDKALEAMKGNNSGTKMIIVISDGDDGSDHHRSMEQIQADAKATGVQIMMLAMGAYVTEQSLDRNFKGMNRKIIKQDGSDIVSSIIALIKKAQEERLRNR
ncbi:MAG: AAA family ATPase [Deltaproteobacteria bacterium]|nr:AAA family ATPase [Deltaproteobacteria bacterium]